jgi:gamma-butyrobetaine dioxygenase
VSAEEMFLRDNCSCPKCLHPLTLERTVTVIDPGDGPHDVAVTPPTDLNVPRQPLQDPIGRVPYVELAEADGIARWLQLLVSQGAVIIDGAPTTSETVMTVAELVGPARPTNFGVMFDVLSKPDPNNSAYTAQGLDLHTDLPNWANPPDVQLLHCLANDAAGGDSTLADGFALADALRTNDPAAYDMLSTWPVPFRFHDDRDDIRHTAPILEHRDGLLHTVRFNNWIRAVDPAAAADPAFYDAYLTWWCLVRMSAHVRHFRLAAGEVLCFDNRRMLHGRSEFQPNTGLRHLQGCYLDMDMVRSRLRRCLVAR